MSRHPHALEEKFTPRVPELIRKQATEVEAYILDLTDVTHQQNEAIILTIISVEEQTKLTNGRVTGHDAALASLVDRSKEWDREVSRSKAFRRAVGILVGILTPASLILFDKIADHVIDIVKVIFH